MRLLRTLACLAITLLLASCASMPSNVGANEKLDPSKGVLLASVTADHNRQVLDAWFFFRKKGTTEERRLDAFGFSPIGRHNDYPAHPSRVGRLNALAIEPGEYELVKWTLYVRRFGGYGYITPARPLEPLAFTVAPGKITYLGNLHLDTVVGRNVFGIDIPAGARADISDWHERDYPLLKKKYPGLNELSIVSSVPGKAAWSVAP